VRDLAIVAAVVLVFAVLAVTEPAFLTSRNLLNVANSWAPVAVMACGGAFVLMLGGLDLSVHALFTLSAILAGKAMNSSSVEVGLLVGVLVGLGLGVFNGLFVTLGKVNPYMATITSGVLILGVVLANTKGELVSVTDPRLVSLSDFELAGIDLPLLVLAVVSVAAMYLLNRTVFGRHILAVGGNPEAARLSGVRVKAVITAGFALSGLTAGIAALIVLSRTGSAGPTMGDAVLFNVVAGLLVGGISVQGGSGAIWRALIGVTLIALIDNGLTLANVDPVYQSIVQGGIIAIALVVDAHTRRQQ
jgi:ribose transport system permease protein